MMYQMKVNGIYKVKSTTHGQKCYSKKTLLSIKSKVPVYNGRLSLSRKKNQFHRRLTRLIRTLFVRALSYSMTEYLTTTTVRTKQKQRII